MQLLGLTTALILLALPLASSGERTWDKCDSTRTADLLRCTSRNLELTDGVLNVNYKQAMISSRTQIRIKLRNTQRSWLRFRDSYCEAISDDISPGEEAEIEKTSCLAHLSADRAREIQRLYRHPDDDGYFQLISALERAGYNRAELLSRLQSSDDGNTEWVEYISLNCNLLKEVNEESVEKCRIRNNAYRSY